MRMLMTTMAGCVLLVMALMARADQRERSKEDSQPRGVIVEAPQSANSTPAPPLSSRNDELRQLVQLRPQDVLITTSIAPTTRPSQSNLILTDLELERPLLQQGLI